MTDSGDFELQRTQILRPAAAAAAPGQARLPVLVVMRGAQVGRRYLLNEDALVLGRRADRAQLVIAGDPQVSSLHCRIERGTEPDAWRIVDLGSTNGTVVHGQRKVVAALRDGDRIHLGETVLKFSFHDELEAAFYQQVDQLMNVDELTGLPVQRAYRERLAEALARCQVAGRRLAVFMLDLDGLKRINDAHGHLVGARAIAVIGRRLGVLVAAAHGIVSRFGGDEFSACVPDCDPMAALALGERLRAAVADEPVTHGDVVVRPTISIGFACLPESGRSVEALTRSADEALYRAKAAGRDCVRG